MSNEKLLQQLKEGGWKKELPSLGEIIDECLKIDAINFCLYKTGENWMAEAGDKLRSNSDEGGYYFSLQRLGETPLLAVASLWIGLNKGNV